MDQEHLFVPENTEITQHSLCAICGRIGPWESAEIQWEASNETTEEAACTFCRKNFKLPQFIQARSTRTNVTTDTLKSIIGSSHGYTDQQFETLRIAIEIHLANFDAVNRNEDDTPIT